MAEYEYDVAVKKLLPPMGSLNYFAKVLYLFQRGGSNHGKLNVEFGETWGVDEAEARQKMIANVEAWIKRHPPS